jgi:hypothetical protein
LERNSSPQMRDSVLKRALLTNELFTLRDQRLGADPMFSRQVVHVGEIPADLLIHRPSEAPMPAVSTVRIDYSMI